MFPRPFYFWGLVAVAKVVIRKQKEDKANSIKVTWDFATERALMRLASLLVDIIRSDNGCGRLEGGVSDSRSSARKVSEKNLKRRR